MRMRSSPEVSAHPVVALALAVLIGLLCAGCGSNANADSGTTGSGDQKAADRDQAVKFAACMRQNGVEDFPDPNAKGDFDYGVSVSPQAWQQALAACKELQPPGSLSADRSPEEQAAGLRLARCIRANGVRDFPDPANGEPLIDTTRIPSTERKGGMAVLNAAIKKCRDDLTAAADSKP